MLRRLGTALGLFAAHLCCSGVAVVMIVGDLMSSCPHWMTDALSFTLFLPMMALEYAGLGLMERSLPFALVVNSIISVGLLLAGRRAAGAYRWRKPNAEPGAAADRRGMTAFSGS